MKMSYRSYKWRPLLIVVLAIVVVVSVFSLTDLKYYLAPKRDVFLHLLKNQAHEVEESGNLAFSFTFDPERPVQNKQMLAQKGGLKVHLVNCFSHKYDGMDFMPDDSDADTAEGQFTCILDFYGTKEGGAIQVLSPNPLPQPGSEFFQDMPADLQNNFIGSSFRFHSDRAPDCQYVISTENISLVVGEAVFHPDVYSYEAVAEGDYFFLRVYYTFFSNPNDFTRVIGAPRAREATIKVDSLYVNEYRTNPIIGGILGD